MYPKISLGGHHRAWVALVTGSRSSNHRPDRLDPLDVLFATIVETSATIASTSKRSEKTRLLAELLGALDPAEVVPVVGFLTGDLHQGSIGIGWVAVSEVGDSRASASTLQVGEIDATITELDSITGTGSRRRRRDTLDELFSRATEAEADFLRRLFIGELRQGANQGVMTDAVARGVRDQGRNRATGRDARRRTWARRHWLPSPPANRA